MKKKVSSGHITNPFDVNTIRDFNFNNNVNSHIQMNIYPSINPMDSQDFRKDGMPHHISSIQAANAKKNSKEKVFKQPQDEKALMHQPTTQTR